MVIYTSTVTKHTTSMLAVLLFLPLVMVDIGEAVITSTNVGEKLRLFQPTFLLVEQLMDVKDRHECTEKMFCLIETNLPHEEHNPLTYYSRFLTNTHGDFDNGAFTEVEALTRKFPKLSKTIDSIKFGQHANDSQQCNQRYAECSMTDNDILIEVNAFSDDSIAKYGFPPSNQIKRDACFWGSLGCGAVGGACAVCIASTGGTCTVACGPTVSAACSGFGLGCLFG